MLRWASSASAWLCGVSICHTAMLAARVILVAMPLYQIGVLAL